VLNSSAVTAPAACSSPHTLIGKISFTGSIATTKRIAAATAGELKRLTLELGATTQRSGSIRRPGGPPQRGPKRINAAESLRPGLVDALVERARAAKLGNGTDPDTATDQLLRGGSRFTDLGVQRIAEAAGVGRSSFYFSFRDKTDLLIRLAGTLKQQVFNLARTGTQKALAPASTE
jgi:hypothetical protein